VNATRLRLRYLSVNKYLTPAGGVFQLGKTLKLGEDILGEPPASDPASLFHELVILTLELVTGTLYQDLGHLVRDALAGKEIPDCKYG